MAASVEAFEDEAELGPLLEDWDRLAVAARRPYCAPAWMLAWWRHARPEHAALRVLAVRDGDELIGLAPLWEGRGSLHAALTGRLSPPTGPFAGEGRAAEVAAALADSIPAGSALQIWDQLDRGSVAGSLGERWGERQPWVFPAAAMPTPVVQIGGLDYDGWLAQRSSKFRQESRRLGRRLADAGGVPRLVDPESMGPALDAFIELHGSRWQGRGGSNALIPGLREMLLDAAETLVPSGRMRVFVIEVEGRVIAANVLVAAGGEVCGWNSGFDEEWARYSPAMLLTLHALADATGRGEERISLGPGDGGYKRRLADGEDEITAVTIVPRGRGYAGARLRLLGHQARWSLSKRLPTGTKKGLRSLLRRR